MGHSLVQIHFRPESRKQEWTVVVSVPCRDDCGRRCNARNLPNYCGENRDAPPDGTSCKCVRQINLCNFFFCDVDPNFRKSRKNNLCPFNLLRGESGRENSLEFSAFACPTLFCTVTLLTLFSFCTVSLLTLFLEPLSLFCIFLG